MKYYVTMTDKFMSGWGMAKGKINKLILTCDSYIEAKTVYENARRRSEMKYISIRVTKPSYNPTRYYVSWHDKTDYDTWFRPNQFIGG